MDQTQAQEDYPRFTGGMSVARPFQRQWMLLGNPALYIDRLVREHGDFVFCRGILDFHLVNDPSLVRQVLRDTNRDFDKNSRIYDHFRNVFGNGLVTAEGESWKRKRKLMQPMFGPSAIKSFFAPMLESANAACEGWSGATAGGAPLEMADEMDRLTLEIAGRAFFSDGFEGSIERIRKWTEAINRYSAKPPLPVVSNLRFPSPTNLRLRRTMADFRDFMRSLIRARADAEPKEDLLGILLNARDEDGNAMEEDEICEEILGMIIGGHETTATALTWIWYELHHHPDVEEKLVEEIRSVVGEDPLGPEHFCQMKYANMVIQEAMRLHPPFWFENRNTTTEVELGGQTIPRGAMVAFSRYSLHRHPDFWESPDSFDPSRFDPENRNNPGASCAYVPFGGGPRVCIGRHFAMMEMLVIVITVLQRYRVSIHPRDRHQMSAKLTMAPKYGLLTSLTPRL